MPTSINEVLELFDRLTYSKMIQGDNWAVDTDRRAAMDSSSIRVPTYDDTFRNIIQPHQSIFSLIQELKMHYRSLAILDLFGSGKFFDHDDEGVSILGVRIMDIDPEKDRRNPKRSVIEFNLYDAHSSRSPDNLRALIDQFLSLHQQESFHLICCRPVGPFKNHTKEFQNLDPADIILVYFDLMKFFYEFLEEDGGIMLVALPEVVDQDLLYSNLSSFFQSLGVSVFISKADPLYEDGESEWIMKIIRHQNSVSFLPEEIECIKRFKASRLIKQTLLGNLEATSMTQLCNMVDQSPEIARRVL